MDEMASPKKLDAIGSWSFWLFRMMRLARIGEESLALDYDERRELHEYLTSERAPDSSKAYLYGSRLGRYLPFAAGITGLYAAGYVSETLSLLAAAITDIGPGSALTILSTLPAIVDTMLAPDAMVHGDVEIARAVAAEALAKYGSSLDKAWAFRDDIKQIDEFHRGSDGVDRALHRFFIVAQTLEESGNHEARDVRDACFHPILFSGRDANNATTPPEVMYEAFLAAEANFYFRPLLKQSDFDDWLKYGKATRISPCGNKRTVELVSAISRQKSKKTKGAL